MFEKALRLKLRFQTPQGQLTTEDLWDLPLKHARRANLDAIAIGLDKQLKETSVSFVEAKSTEATQLTVAFDVVKHVISVKLAENDKRLKSAAKSDQKKRILEIIAKKEDETLEGQSIEELRAEIAKL